MSDDVLRDVVEALDAVVIERMPNAGYLLMTPAPAWLAGALADGQSLGDAFPFLRHFLQFAGRAWHDGPPARAESGPFEAEIGEDRVLLTATALSVGGRRMLVLQRLAGDTDPRAILQRAREQLLDRERLERAVMAVHGPAQAVAEACAEIAALGLPPAAHDAVGRLDAAVDRLRTAVAPLPVPPRRRRSDRA